MAVVLGLAGHGRAVLFVVRRNDAVLLGFKSNQIANAFWQTTDESSPLRLCDGESHANEDIKNGLKIENIIMQKQI